jgi:hypothetical protein
LTAEAKLEIQEEIRAGKVQLIWSYILDYENNKNPYQERKERIKGWKKYAAQDVQESSELIKTANLLNQKGLQKIDSLHIACVIFCEMRILEKRLKRLQQTNPIGSKGFTKAGIQKYPVNPKK